MRNTGATLVFAMPTSGGLYEVCVSRIFIDNSMDKIVQVTTHKKKKKTLLVGALISQGILSLYFQQWVTIKCLSVQGV